MTRVEYGGTIESIKELLTMYHLTGFSSIVLKPTWLSKEAREQFEGCSTIVGNFVEYSNAFYIITDDTELLNEFKPYFRRKVYERYDCSSKKYILEEKSA